MKTFIVSLFIFGILTALVICNAVYIGKTTDRLLALAEELPRDAESFEREAESAADKTEALYALWDDRVIRLTFTMGYESINRADGAILDMRVSMKNGNGEDFSVARAVFCDAIRRLHSLESFSFRGIF